MRQNTN